MNNSTTLQKIDMLYKIQTDDLTYAMARGIINTNDVLNQIQLMKKQEILNQHPFQIWEAKDGRWKTYIPNDANEGRKLIAKSTKEKLERFIVSFYIAKEEKEKTYTFKQWYHTWYNYKKTKVKQQTLERYDVDFNRFYLDAPFINQNIKDIEILEVEIWLQEQIVKYNLKKKAYYNMQTLVKGPLEYAYKKKLIQENIWDFIDISTNLLLQAEKPSSETQVFNKQERTLMAEQAWKDYYENTENLVPLMYLLDDQTGLRNGELVALKPRDIINGKMLSIQRQETKLHENGILIRRVEDNTKTPATKREIYLTEKAKDILNLVPKSGEYLFQKDNRRINASITDAYIRRLCRKVGIRVRGMHKVRKTFISNLFAVGLHPERIRIISGHDDLSTLYKSYCFCIDTEEEILLKLNAAS